MNTSAGYLEMRIPFECDCSYKTKLFFKTDQFPRRIKCQFCNKVYGLAIAGYEYRIYSFATVSGGSDAPDIVTV